MEIVSVRHRGLKRLLENNDDRGLSPAKVKRIRRVLSALVSAESLEQVEGPPGWRVHRLSGDRLGIWSISVSGNWRVTFIIDGDRIRDLDLEDYH